MATWDLGSVSEFVYNLVDNVPTAISGTYLIELSNQAMQTVENYTGTTIGSKTIIQKYQPAIWKLTVSNLAGTMISQGVDAASFKLGDLNVGKGKTSSISDVRDGFKADAMEDLRLLGKKVNFYQTWTTS